MHTGEEEKIPLPQEEEEDKSIVPRRLYPEIENRIFTDSDLASSQLDISVPAPIPVSEPSDGRGSGSQSTQAKSGKHSGAAKAKSESSDGERQKKRNVQYNPNDKSEIVYPPEKRAAPGRVKAEDLQDQEEEIEGIKHRLRKCRRLEERAKVPLTRFEGTIRKEKN